MKNVTRVTPGERGSADVGDMRATRPCLSRAGYRHGSSPGSEIAGATAGYGFVSAAAVGQQDESHYLLKVLWRESVLPVSLQVRASRTFLMLSYFDGSAGGTHFRADLILVYGA
jgi:hypothetical protein